MQIRVPNSGNSRLKYSNFPLFGRSRNPFVLYNIGGQTPQIIADFEADKYASANKNFGPELVTNGTFDSDFTDWSDINSPSKTVVSGEAEITGDAFDGILQDVAVTSGNLYKISLDITSKTGAVGYAIYAGANATSANLLNVTNSSTGTQEHFLLATTNIFSVVVWSRGTAVTFTVDNISVREVVSYSPASTTATSLLTHTRAGTATYTDSTGTLQTAATNELRKDNHIWNGSSWVKRCLVEPQRTNLFDYSVPDNSNWTVSASTLTENVSGVTSPDGNENFAFFRENATTAIHFLGDSYAFVLGTTYTLSGFVKQATSDEVIQLIFPTPAFGAVYANFDFSTGSFGTSSGVTTHVENFGSGIYRIGITATATASSSNVCGFVLTNNDDSAGRVPSYLGDNTSGFYIWGAQLEASSVPTSHIPTAGATVTRPADALSIDSTLLPYDSTAMTIAMEGEVTYADTNVDPETIFVRWALDGNNFIRFVLQTNAGFSGAVRIDQRNAGVDDFVRADTYSPGTNVPFNIASRNTSSDINGAVDGTALTADTTPTALPNLSATDFDIAPTGVVNIKSLRILGGYGATDAELEAATT